MDEIEIKDGMQFVCGDGRHIYTITKSKDSSLCVVSWLWIGGKEASLVYFTSAVIQNFRDNNWTLLSQPIPPIYIPDTINQSNSKETPNLGKFLSGADKYTGNTDGETATNASGFKFL